MTLAAVYVGCAGGFGAFTVTVKLALTPVFEVEVTVMIAVPAATAFTFPFASTVATLVFEEVHFTPLFVAFEGETVAETLNVPPTSNVVFPLFKEIPVTATGFTVTVTVVRTVGV